MKHTRQKGNNFNIDASQTQTITSQISPRAMGIMNSIDNVSHHSSRGKHNSKRLLSTRGPAPHVTNVTSDSISLTRVIAARAIRGTQLKARTNPKRNNRPRKQFDKQVSKEALVIVNDNDMGDSDNFDGGNIENIENNVLDSQDLSDKYTPQVTGGGIGTSVLRGPADAAPLIKATSTPLYTYIPYQTSNEHNNTSSDSDGNGNNHINGNGNNSNVNSNDNGNRNPPTQNIVSNFNFNNNNSNNSNSNSNNTNTSKNSASNGNNNKFNKNSKNKSGKKAHRQSRTPRVSSIFASQRLKTMSNSNSNNNRTRPIVNIDNGHRLSRPSRRKSQPKPRTSRSKPRKELVKDGSKTVENYRLLSHSRSQHNSPVSKKYRNAFTPPANKKKKKIWYKRSTGGSPEISNLPKANMNVNVNANVNGSHNNKNNKNNKNGNDSKNNNNNSRVSYSKRQQYTSRKSLAARPSSTSHVVHVRHTRHNNEENNKIENIDRINLSTIGRIIKNNGSKGSNDEDEKNSGNIPKFGTRLRTRQNVPPSSGNTSSVKIAPADKLYTNPRRGHRRQRGYQYNRGPGRSPGRNPTSNYRMNKMNRINNMNRFDYSHRTHHGQTTTR